MNEREETNAGDPALEEGLRLFEARDLEGAHGAFERAHRKAMKDARRMSWYGVTLVLVEKNSNLGILYCDQAVRLGGADAELLLNLARVHLALGQRERAVRAIQRGLEAAPADARLKAAQAAMGWRRKPILPFLPRRSFPNRWLGRLRYRFTRASESHAELSPVTLGLPPEESSRS